MDAEDGGGGPAGLPVGNGADRLPAAAFQFLRSSGWSAHDKLEGRGTKKDSFPAQDAVGFDLRGFHHD